MISKHLLNAWRFENTDVAVRGQTPTHSSVVYDSIGNDRVISGNGVGRYIRYNSDVTGVLNFRKGTIIFRNWWTTNFTVFPTLFVACKSNGVNTFPFVYFSTVLYYHPSLPTYNKKLSFQIGHKPNSSNWTVRFYLYSNIDMNDTNPKTTIITWDGTTNNVGAIYNYQSGQLVDITNYSISGRGTFDYTASYSIHRNMICAQCDENYVDGNFLNGQIGEIQIYNECFNMNELKKLLLLGRPTI